MKIVGQPEVEVIIVGQQGAGVATVAQEGAATVAQEGAERELH